MGWDGWMSNTSYLSGGGSSGSLWDSITGSASSIFGGIGSAANSLGSWAQQNQGGAMILGSVIGAGGNYYTEKMKEKAARDQFDRENARYDQLHQTVDTSGMSATTTPGSVNGSAPLTNGGLLSQMQQTDINYTNKNKQAV